jgi:hypothetical protein
MTKKNTKSKEPTFILNGNPTKSGTYKVLYTRAKSTEVREGRRRSRHGRAVTATRAGTT